MTNKDMQKFMKSGKIVDYLDYVAKKNKHNTELANELVKGVKNDNKGRYNNKDH